MPPIGRGGSYPRQPPAVWTPGPARPKPALSSAADASIKPVHDPEHELDAAPAEEAAPFDVPTLSASNAAAALLKSMVGSGILALPWALMRFGLVAGLVVLSFLAFINVIAIRLLIACRVRLHEREGERPSPEDVGTATLVRGDGSSDEEGGLVLNPYEMVATAIMGPRFALACTCALVSAQLGVVTAYLDVVTVTVLVLLPSVPRVAVVFVLWLLLSVAGLLRGLSQVSWLALAGLSCYLTVVAALVHFGLPRLREREASELVLFDPSGFGWFYGIAMFAFEGIGTVLPILEEMRTLDRPQRFHKVVDCSYAAAFVFYVLIGSLGYLAYGAQTEDVILFNFPDSLLTVTTTRSMALMMLFTAVVQIYPIHRVADAAARRVSRRAKAVSTLERFALRGLVTLVPAALACVAPDVAPIVDIVGASCFSFLGLLAPVAMYLRLFQGELRLGRRVLLWLLGAFGLLGGVVGTISPFVLPGRRLR